MASMVWRSFNNGGRACAGAVRKSDGIGDRLDLLQGLGAYGQRRELGCLCQAGSRTDSLGMTWLYFCGFPMCVPGPGSMSHSVRYGNVTIGPLPGELAFSDLKGPFKPLDSPCLSHSASVLEMGLISALFLRCFKLMPNGVLHQLQGALITMLLPMVAGVEELRPCWFSGPVLLHVVEALAKPFMAPLAWVG